MSTVSAIALGDAAIAAVAALLFVYEAWLFGRAGRAREHAYTAVICLTAAAFATLMVFHYDAAEGTALWLTRAEAVSLAVLVHAVIALCGTLASRPLPVPGWAIAVSCLACAALSLSPWMIGTVEPKEMLLLDHPFWRRPQTPQLTVLLIYGFLMAGGSILWLASHRDAVRQEARYFVLGLGAWMSSAVIAFLLSVVHRNPPLSIAEYGFFAFALSMVARDTGRFMQMLRASEANAATALTGQALAEKLSSEVIGSIDAGFVAVRDDLTIELWNPVMESLTSVPVEDALGRPLFDVLPSAFTPDALASALEATMSGHLSQVDDLYFEAKDGARRFEVTLSPRGPDSTYGGAILLLSDMTERDRLTAHLMGVDRLAAVGTLAAGIGHEVNNPLSWMLLNLRSMQSALREKKAPAEFATLVAESLDGAKRIRGIVDGLRAYSKVEDERVAADLSEVVRGALTLTNNDLRHRATVTVDVQSTPTVEVVEGRLGQVFVNLLINAGHAVEEHAGEERSVHVRVFQRGADAVVEIIDTGGGIDESVLPRLFDPFFTTKVSGTGLGLGISQETVHELGGRIEVETQPGKGSTFRVVLPRSDRAPDPVVESQHPEAAVDDVRVLVVDDEPALGRALMRTLERVGWSVEWAESADDAIAILERDVDFTAVLTDLSMPQRTGMDLYEEAQERWPELEPRFLFMTGGTFTKEAAAFRAEQESRVLDKPIERAELVSRIGQLG